MLLFCVFFPLVLPETQKGNDLQLGSCSYFTVSRYRNYETFWINYKSGWRQYILKLVRGLWKFI